MATLDIVLLVILLYGGYKGFRTGFLMEIIAILALILGVIGGFMLLNNGMEFLDEKFDISGTFLPYLSFLLIFILIVIGVYFLGRSLKKVLDMTLLGSLDNIAGAVLGLLKYAFMLSVIFWITSAFHLTLSDRWTENSFIYPWIGQFAPSTIDLLGNLFPFLEGLVDRIRDLIGS